MFCMYGLILCRMIYECFRMYLNLKKKKREKYKKNKEIRKNKKNQKSPQKKNKVGKWFLPWMLNQSN